MVIFGLLILVVTVGGCLLAWLVHFNVINVHEHPRRRYELRRQGLFEHDTITRDQIITEHLQQMRKLQRDRDAYISRFGGKM